MQATVPAESDGVFLDSFLVQAFPTALQSKRQAQKVAKEEGVFVNGTVQRGGKVRTGDVVKLEPPDPKCRTAKVTDADEGVELHDFLHSKFQLSRKRSREVTNLKCVKVNGNVCSRGATRLSKNDTVSVTTPEATSNGGSASDLTDKSGGNNSDEVKVGDQDKDTKEHSNEKHCVYYDDQHIAIVYKPTGMSMSVPDNLDTLLRGLKSMQPTEGGLLRPEFFTHLDNSVCGPVLIVKSGIARHHLLTSSIELRFRAIVVGQCTHQPGTRFDLASSAPFWVTSSPSSGTESSTFPTEESKPIDAVGQQPHQLADVTVHLGDGNEDVGTVEECGESAAKRPKLTTERPDLNDTEAETKECVETGDKKDVIEASVVCVSRSNSAGYLTTLEIFCPPRSSSRRSLTAVLSTLGCPLIGALSAGMGVLNKQKGLFLALSAIHLAHPITGEQLEVNAGEPLKFAKLRESEESAWTKKRQALAERLQKEGITLNVDSLNASDIAKAVGFQDFGPLRFKVAGEVFVPRPASWTLVEAVEKLLPSGGGILDLGTGTGALLLSCISRIPSCWGIGIDTNPQAVQLATENAACLNITSRASFALCDFEKLHLCNFASLIDALLPSITPESPVSSPSLPFDAIVCNPPYLSSSNSLQYSQLKYEPTSALVFQSESCKSTSVGCAYEAIADSLALCNPAILKKGGYLVLEIGVQQGPLVKSLLMERHFEYITSHHDKQNIERCLVFRSQT